MSPRWRTRSALRVLPVIDDVALVCRGEFQIPGFGPHRADSYHLTALIPGCPSLSACRPAGHSRARFHVRDRWVIERIPLTTSYKHRFARTLYQISRDNPEISLGDRFTMTNLQLREARLTALIAELESCRRVRDSSYTTPASQLTPLAATALQAAREQASILGGGVPVQASWTSAVAETLLPQTSLGG